MSRNENRSNIQEDLSNDKQVLLDKLTKIFDPETAFDFVSPKTFEPRRHLTLEDLKHVNYESPEEHLQRLRSMVYYETTTQSLSRPELEASYQAFIRNQINQRQYTRDELEQFVRNSSDIDIANIGHDVSPYPLQSHLLFRSAKLNEQRAKTLKSAGTIKSLKDLNDNFNLNEYFPETMMRTSKSAYKPKQTHEKRSTSSSHPRSLHVEHRDKKYRITFLKDSNNLQYSPKLTTYPNINRQALFFNPRQLDSAFDTDSSTTHGPSTGTNTSKIHRDIFPPLSLSALKEYRPSITPNVSSASTMHSQQRRGLLKSEFIWEDSIVSSKNE